MKNKKSIVAATLAGGAALVVVVAMSSGNAVDDDGAQESPSSTTTAPVVETTSATPASTTSTSTSTTTTSPPFDHVIATTDDFASAPAGARILVQPGVYEVSVSPKEGQVWVCAEGAVLDGGWNHQYAFFSAAPHVEIDGCEIRNYNTPLQEGAIFGRIPDHTDGGWAVSNVWIHHNAATGIKLSGNNAQLLDSHIEWNDQMGFGMLHGSDQLVEGNQINNNNPGDRYDWGWEAGGSKNWGTIRLTLRGNVAHENNGPGLWSDWNNIDTLYEDNVVYANVGAPGIFHEVSYEATIRNNDIYENGFPDGQPGRPFRARAGIHIAGSRGVEIYGNYVHDNAKGITGVEQCRESSSERFAESDGPWRLTGVVVYDNIIENSGLSIARTDCDYPIDMRYFDNEWIGDNTIE